MSAGGYWMFFHCPKCGKKFMSGLDRLTQPHFGKCPACGADGVYEAEGGAPYPVEISQYEDTD